ncbi:MAG: 3-isopropylmalate dehydratase small subunit [Candidatus Omnitrophica bacterium]|nr:3-isopropylmalate dehydratase small subunit [Candidatus Omnitrophota bacterium]MBU2251275.1 3-isopropylmalate dehydratase small subunit [Candidatus Omnitrophota bacterium]MBU2266328.1 3-isopropylmalate dehydratase small subunit [Candidatus Omnitrophota bacterium]MBU2474001.1 3-isopropylmalate dehydratase small subunit [Candidatus Omnitrophota bacterium]
MIIKGKVHKFGDNINTDDIIAAKYLDSQDEAFLGSKCMENIDKDFFQKVAKGDIIVAGKNFGCGSSREHAPVAIKGCGVSLVIAESFARIFYRNSINVGLPILVSKDCGSISAGSLLSVDLNQGLIKDLNSGKIFSSEAFPVFMQEIIEAGGLLSWIKKKEKQ